MEYSSSQGSAAALWSDEESADVFNTLLWSLRSGWAITTGQGLPDPAKLEDIITGS